MHFYLLFTFFLFFYLFFKIYENIASYFLQWITPFQNIPVHFVLDLHDKNEKNLHFFFLTFINS